MKRNIMGKMIVEFCKEDKEEDKNVGEKKNR